jgi:hypothetical protein
LDKFCEPIGSSVLDLLSPNKLAEVQVDIVLAKLASAESVSQRTPISLVKFQTPSRGFIVKNGR